MDMKVARDVLETIKSQQNDRKARYRELESEIPDLVDDLWLFTDGSFVGEMCLMLLVAVRHQVERDSLRLAARVTSDGRVLTSAEYSKSVDSWRARLRKGQQGWGNLWASLVLDRGLFESMETLRHVANSYKHNPLSEPDSNLVDHLQRLLGKRPPKLGKIKNFAPLSESDVIRQALAVSLGLKEQSDYTEITERFLDRAEQFLADVKNRSSLSPVKREVVSLNPDDFAH